MPPDLMKTGSGPAEVATGLNEKNQSVVGFIAESFQIESNSVSIQGIAYHNQESLNVKLAAFFNSGTIQNNCCFFEVK